MTVLNVTIFCESTVLKISFSDCKLCLTLSYFTYMSFFFFNNSVNQGKLGLSLGIMEGKGLSFLKQ